MAKNAYVGVDNKAKKIKNIYVGIDDKARKVKKVYIGVNGVARLCYSGDEGYSKLKKIAQYKLDEYPNDITYVPGEDSCYVSTNNGNVYKFNNNAQIVWQKSVYDEIGYIYIQLGHLTKMVAKLWLVE